MADTTKKTITVEQIRSAIRRPEIQTQDPEGPGAEQAATARATLEDTPCGARHDREGRSTSCASSSDQRRFSLT